MFYMRKRKKLELKKYAELMKKMEKRNVLYLSAFRTAKKMAYNGNIVN